MVALVSAATGPVSRPASNGRGLQSRHSAMDRRTGRAPVMHARVSSRSVVVTIAVTHTQRC